MKRFIKLLSLGLVISVLLLCVVACGNDDDSDSGSKKRDKAETNETATPSPSDEKTPTSTEDPQPTDEPTPTEAPTPTPKKSDATCEKITSIDLAGKTIKEYTDYGFIYSMNDKLGYVCADGTTDTGARYAEVKRLIGGYKVTGALIVSSLRQEELDGTLESVNRYGLISQDGKEIIPEEYAIFEYLSNRYILAIKATGETTSKDECMIFSYEYTYGEISHSKPKEGDKMYKGEWVLFDIQRGAAVNGAKGTKSLYNAKANDGVAKYVTDDGVKHMVNAKGEELAGDTVVFGNGTYSAVDVSEAKVFSSEGDVLFTYNPNEFTLTWVGGREYGVGGDGGYIAEKRKDNQQTYSLVDEQGQVVSAEFSRIIDIFEPYILAEDASDGKMYLYKKDGSRLLDVEVRNVRADEVFDRCFFVKFEEKTYAVDYSGNIILETEEGIEKTSMVNFFIRKWNEGKTGYIYYNFADNGYTLTGNDVCMFLISAKNAGGRKDLIDVYTGEKVIQGYYSYSAFVKDDCIFIAAETEKKDVVDIFKYASR